MSNYNLWSSQVPFGDGNCLPIAEAIEGDDLTEATMEKAMKDIYTSCDVDNSDMVLVSKLVDFITPFMQQNMTELLRLKKALDPHNVDPYVNSETFFNAMTEWSSRLREELVESEESLQCSTPRKLESIEEKDSCGLISQKSSVGQYFLKGFAESGSQNLSTSSSYSCLANNISDVTSLEERVNELEHQNRKLTDELTHIRLQLSSSEEQNEVLQSDVDKITRKLAQEQQLHGQLKTNIKDYEDRLEISLVAQKQIGKLEKKVASLEKDNLQLKESLQSMEVEKQKLEDRIEQFINRDEDSKKLIIELQTDINFKDQAIANLEEANSQLKDKISENQNLLSHYTEVNEHMKMDKVKLEQNFREHVFRTPLSSRSKSPSSSFNESTTINKSEHTATSPKEKNSSGNHSILDSSEDEMLWKMQLANITSPLESLEQEIVQASSECSRNECIYIVNKYKCSIQHLEAKITEYENSMKQLVKDNSHLHSQISRSDKQITENDEKHRQLQAKYKDLEADNSSKYIRIVDLMEQIEILHKQLVSSDDRFVELCLLKEKISDLELEQKNLEEQLKQSENQDSETLLQHLQSMRSECELLRSRLDLSTKAEQKLSKEFENMCYENAELRKKNEFLDEAIRELSSEKAKLNNTIQKLSEETNSLKKDIKNRNEKELEVTAKLTKLLNENLDLKEKLSRGDPDRTAAQIEQVETQKVIIIEHTNTIEKLYQTIDEKKRQILMLKKIISHQNTNIKTLENNKLKTTDQIYEQKSANERLTEENKELVEKLEQSERDKKRLQSQLLSVGSSNKTMQKDLENVLCDKKMKDTQNIFREHQSLLEDKDLLPRQNEELFVENSLLKETQDELQKQLHHLEQHKNDLSSTITELNSKLCSAEASLNELTEKLFKIEDREQRTRSNFTEEIDKLQTARQMLQLQNKNLQEELETLRINHEILVNEREIWLIEKNNWQQMKHDYTNNLANAKDENCRLQQRLNEIDMNSASVQENSHDDEVFCENCVALKNEIDDLNAYIDELNYKISILETEERNSKKGNFEKMQLKIEKLKSKCEDTEELLKIEKQKIKGVEETNLKLFGQISNLKSLNEENAVIMEERLKLERRLNETLEILKVAQTEKHMLQQERDCVCRNNSSLEKNFRESVNDNDQLRQEIADLHNKKTALERKVNKLQRDIKFKVELETKSEVTIKAKEQLLETAKKSNDQLHQEVYNLRKQKADLERQLDKLQDKLKDKTIKIEQYQTEVKEKEDLFNSINKECVELQEEVENLTNEKNNLDKKLEKIQHDLQKSEAKNLSIRKLLTDMRSSVYDDGDDALQENVEALLKEKDSQVNVLQQQLKGYEDELKEVKLKLNESHTSLSSLSEHVETVNKKLIEKRQRLSRSILTSVDNWRIILENRTDMQAVLDALHNNDNISTMQIDDELVNTVTDCCGPLDEEMFKFKYQIHTVALLLEALSTMKLSVSVNADTENSSQSQPAHRFIKKVTLKTTTTEVRSVDPNDPLIEQTPKTESRSCEKRKDDNDDSLNKPSSSHHIETPLLKVGNEGFVDNPALDVASPSLSDTVLESLNLLDKDRSPDLTETEMEHRFGMLVAAFMIDVSSMRDRYRQQQTRHNDIESRFSIETEQLVTTLRAMEGMDENHHLELHIRICLQQVESLVRMFSQISESAMQYGALHHEHRLMKCINLMINHAAHLKRIVEHATHQLKSIRSTSLSPNYRKSRMSLSSSCNSSSDDLSLKLNNVCENNDLNTEVSARDTGNMGEADEANVPSMQLQAQEISRGHKRWKRYLFFLEATPYERLYLTIFFLFVLYIVWMGVTKISSGDTSAVSYPWQWVSWDDIFAPYVKKSFPNGPPPV